MRRFSSLALVLAFVLALALPATAHGQPGPREKWLTATRGPFTIYSNAKPAKTGEVLLALEQLRAVVSALSPSDDAPDRPTVLYAFGSRRSGEAYFSTPSRPDVVHMAEYLVGPEATHIVLNAAEPPSEVLPWVYRAYLGQDLLRRFPGRPLWARSGLAHFYATLQVEGNGTVRVGRPDKHHLDILRTVNWIPLSQFFSLTPDSPVMRSGRSRQVFEAQAWLMAHYLMTAPEKEIEGRLQRPAVAFSDALDRGLTPEEGLRHVFGLGAEGFEQRLRGYSRGATMSYFKVTLDNMPRADYDIRPVTSAEMSLRLGQHLIRAHTPPPVEAAERHLEPLFGDSELAGDALASLAELRHSSGRRSEAASLYERAFEARPKQALSFLTYARFLADTGGPPAARRQALERALEIDPSLGEGWAQLASTYQEGGESDYARYLVRALEALPERSDLAYNLAMAHLRAGDPTAARQVIAQRLRNPDDRQAASDALREVIRFETVSASNRALQSGDLDSAIAGLESALAEARDPAVREQLEGSLERLKGQRQRNAQIDAFNQAVALLNEGGTTEARRRLEELRPTVTDPALLRSIDDLLDRLGDNG